MVSVFFGFLQCFGGAVPGDYLWAAIGCLAFGVLGAVIALVLPSVFDWILRYWRWFW